MYIIAYEDRVKVTQAVDEVLVALTNGHTRADMDVELEEDFKPITVSGYWVNEVIRIDIKVKK